VAHGYLEFLLALPWNRSSDDNLDLARAEAVLELEHFGLGMVKERIIEFLAVQILRSHASSRLLVVDDEEIARNNLKYVLAKEGYLVETAANGLEALARLERSRFDVILTDLKMDRMDGDQLLLAARRLDPETQVIVITGFATVDSAVDALRKGAAHYLPKPVDIGQLREVVRTILNAKKHAQMTRSPVLCFTGPPGTGKTSIGRAIASALERRFIRVSCAGLRDEAELRGHRRTYVGAMPGRILGEIRRAGVNNPVFMLDEVDKIGAEFRGDAAAALLELLDPEQNARFTDHYLDLPFDLSAAVFIATANAIDRVPGPLRDRLEVIEFPGYTEKEKLAIARRFLVPRQLAASALEAGSIAFSDAAILKIIRDYTHEAGLRNLEREIAAVCRKLARLRVGGSAAAAVIDDATAAQLLGPRKITHPAAGSTGRPGVAVGLVWTEGGGEVLAVEAGVMKGSQQLILTGSLGPVLQESAQAVLSHVRSHAACYGIPGDFFAGHDVHIHLPVIGIGKDGPSAGITMAVALVSVLTGRAVRPGVAMTGELTLSGRMLPVQGLREKVLAARRAGLHTVILPGGNREDMHRLEAEVREGIELVAAEELGDVLPQVLEPPAHSAMR